jgi:hypothetical protein
LRKHTLVKQRILVVGHWHSGTTVLRRVIGACPEVYDYTEEVHIPFNAQQFDRDVHREGFDAYVTKTPLFSVNKKQAEFMSRRDIQTIAIIRDVRDVAGSLLDWSEPINYSVKSWIAVNRLLLDLGVKVVTYEQLFHPDKRIGEFGKLFGWLGLPFHEEYVTGDYRPDFNMVAPPDTNPGSHAGSAYRAWQVAQPVGYFAGKSRVALSAGDEEFIMERAGELTKEIYG